MKKAVFLLTVLFTLLAGSVTVCAETTADGKFNYKINNGNAEITKYNGKGGDVVIPDVIDEKKVTSIGYCAFNGCRGLTSITIPASVTSIGERAFDYCRGLTSITIPEGVTSIGYCAFGDCSGLTSITIPASVTSIGKYAFNGCSGLTSITIQEGVESIGDNAFGDCSDLTSITIPESVTNISSGAFSDCSSLESITVDGSNKVYDSRENCNAIIEKSGNELIVGCKSTIIPEGVTSIGDNAFDGCSGLTSITIPEGVKYIWNSAFDGCSGLTSITIPASVMNIRSSAFIRCSSLESITVDGSNTVYDSRENCNAIIEKSRNKLIVGCKSTIIPEGVESIGGGAFSYCSDLTSITIPEGVESIGDSAFSDCSDLTSITIPEGVTSIGWCAFSDCSGLTSITIPASVTNIGNYAFIRCSSLESITVDGSNKVYDSRENCNAIIEKSGNTLIAGCKSTIIPEGVESIGDDAFSECRGLTSITIPEGVTSIGDRAFDGCSGLTSITIPASVTSMGSYSLDDCDSLVKVVNNSSCDIVLYGGDWKKGSLDGEEIYFIANGTAVREGSGGTDPGDEDDEDEVTVGDFEFEIKGDEAALTAINSVGGSIVIPASFEYGGKTYKVTSIEDVGFARDFSSPASITIPGSVSKIEDDAFASCGNLTEVVIPDSVVVLGESVFFDCPNLSSVKIGKGIRTIPYGTFYDCVSLNSIKIPKNVTGIGEYAFFGSGLTTITIPGTVRTIGNGAFSDCDSIKRVSISEGVEEIGNDAFYNCANGIVIYIPKSVKKVGKDAFGVNDEQIYTIFYSGTEEQWRVIEGIDDCGIEDTYRIYFSGNEPDNDDPGNTNPDNTPELGKAGNENDVSDAFAPVHSNDGSNSEAGSVSSGNAAWTFDPDKSVTVIAVKHVDISKKLETLTKAEGYDSSAKHRYTVDDKKKAKVDKKGILKPKKSGQISVSLEQKVKGSSWTKIGDSVVLYIQLPEMQKKDSQTAAEGATLDAFKYLGHTTYRPNKWISSKPSVASIDENTGIITVHKKGSTKIIAEYGEGKNGSGKKYATKLKIVTGG